MRVVAVATTHAPAELDAADVRVERLRDIEISTSVDGRLLVRATGT